MFIRSKICKSTKGIFFWPWQTSCGGWDYDELSSEKQNRFRLLWDKNQKVGKNWLLQEHLLIMKIQNKQKYPYRKYTFMFGS